MSNVERVIIVTGGASGLGRHYCEALANAGARIVVADVLGEEAAELEDRLNAGAGSRRALAVRTDVTDPESVAALVSQAVNAFGGVDVLVNNAGTYPHQDFDTVSYESWRSVFAVNLDSIFLTSRAVVPVMRAAGGGKIVNVSTNLVWVGLAGMVPYIAAKAGVVGFTRALARELGPDGITVNALAPGALPPDRSRLSPQALESIDAIVDYQCVRRPEEPTDVVSGMLFLTSPLSDFMSGQVLTVDGGLTFH